MADYWVTNPRYFCEICKCWFGNNKISIENHEKGLRHKGNVEKQLRDTRRRAAVKEQEETKVSETLAKIEKAAEAAYKRDQKGLPPRESSVLKAALAKEEKKSKGKKERKAVSETPSSDKVPAVPPPPPSPWQQLLSPEGRIYYYHILTGVSQWECPPELRAPSTKQTPPTAAKKGTSTFGTFKRNAKGAIVPTSRSTAAGGGTDVYNEDSIQGQWLRQMQEKDEFLQKPFTELAAIAEYYNQNEEEEEKGEEPGEDIAPPPPKRFDPYGSWQTVRVRPQAVEEMAEEEEEEETEEVEQKKQTTSSDEEDFREKTLPVGAGSSESSGIKEERSDDVVPGSFKGFSFKKKSNVTARTNIKQRTSDW